MARIIKEYTIRRNEILDAAQRLVYTVGYEQMTIQDILDALQISKGAFYHYFDSKQELLDALVDRMVDGALQVLIPVVQDSGLPALEKIQVFFDTAGRWKTTQKAFILALLNTWYQDGNAIVRQKQLTAAIKQVAPLLSRVVQQGVQEGTFSTSYPDQAGEIVLSILQTVGDSLGQMIISPGPSPGTLEAAQKTVAVYTDALERILGAKPGSVHLIEPDILKEWYS